MPQLELKYRLLGRSGLRVSELSLGTMTFGEDWGWGASEEEAKKIYMAYRDAGGNFLDTANIYTNGASERFVGDFIAGHRSDVVVATKYTNAAPAKSANAGGNQRKNMMESVEASLKRLKTDYIDLYWLHVWDRLTPVEEVMRGFDDLVRQGKILYAGVSDAPAWWVSQANTLADLRGWTPFIGLQIEYSLTERTVERELIPMAKSLGLTVAAWSPLAGGLLSGKYRKDTPPDARYASEMMKSFRAGEDRLPGILDALETVSAEVGKSMAQVAIAWLLHRSVDVIPIIGARKLSQFEDNLAAAALVLTSEQVKKLDDASAIEPGFPERFYQNEFVKGLVYGGFRDRILA